MVPPVAVQFTAVLVVPVTVAVNCCLAFVISETDVGAIVTTGLVTVTVAVWNFLPLATLAALTL
jgi:hypothetical protein